MSSSVSWVHPKIYLSRVALRPERTGSQCAGKASSAREGLPSCQSLVTRGTSGDRLLSIGAYVKMAKDRPVTRKRSFKCLQGVTFASGKLAKFESSYSSRLVGFSLCRRENPLGISS